ncbi:DUF6415 family natural product biosynthesis protein [Streptomyces lunaelactis]|uniref:DUF6415 family natural product biosynthesis protein n=1 Tax=Streptomyces lunaelactis TaxID=1535768 RepID=UPI00359F314D
MAITSPAPKPPAIGHARALRAEDSPGDFLPARGHLRRLALVTQDLLELLAED